MADLDKETVKKLTRLCRIECSEEEQEALLVDLKKIVKYMELLQKIDTENVVPCNHVLEEITNVFREDLIGQTLSREAFLANSPAQIGGMIRVPPVIKQS